MSVLLEQMKNALREFEISEEEKTYKIRWSTNMPPGIHELPGKTKQHKIFVENGEVDIWASNLSHWYSFFEKGLDAYWTKQGKFLNLTSFERIRRADLSDQIDIDYEKLSTEEFTRKYR